MPRPQLPQQVIDTALCLGGNEPDSLERIFSYFSKDYPLAQNAAFLQKEYRRDGKGFFLGDRPYALWFDENGLRLSSGRTASANSATVLSWEDAAKRVRELLDLGRYVPQPVIDRADEVEKKALAERLLYLVGDLSNDAREAGYMSTVQAIYNTRTGYPDMTAQFMASLNDRAIVQSVTDELSSFMAELAKNRDLLRFRYLIRFLVQLLRGKLLTFMSKRINLPLMLGYYDHVVDLKMDFFGNHKTGDIMSRFNDASKVQEALSSVTLTLMIDVVMVILCGFILFNQSRTLFTVICVILGLYIIISVLYIRPLDKRNRQLMQENSQLNSYLKESIDGIQTVKAFSAGKMVKLRTKELFDNLQKYGIKASMLSLSKDALIELMTSVGTLALLWVGAVSIACGEMTLGTLMTFYTLLSYFLSPIQNVIELQSTLQSAVVAAGRLRDILDRSKENDHEGEEKFSFENGNITIEDVYFR